MRISQFAENRFRKVTRAFQPENILDLALGLESPSYFILSEIHAPMAYLCGVAYGQLYTKTEKDTGRMPVLHYFAE